MTAGDKGKKDGGLKPPLQRARVLSGMRPTGRMHIGNYFGALANWVRLQNEVLPTSGAGSQAGAQHAAPLQGKESAGRAGQPAYECFYFIADWHSLTTDYADTSFIAENVIEIATDYLAGGLDPKKCVIFQQSLIPEHAELHLLLSMATPLGELERIPTYKEALENVKDRDLHMYGFLGYPVLQTADITMYGEPGLPLVVPVGEDQVSHVELSRQIVRRFNFFNAFEASSALLARENFDIYVKIGSQLDTEGPGGKVLAAALTHRRTWIDPEANDLLLYGIPVSEWDLYQSEVHRLAMKVGFDNFLQRMRDAAGFFQAREVLNPPQVRLTKTPRLPGLDGRKMSKSYGNTITLSESDADIRAKTKVMVTDPARKRRTDPGNPDVCPVYDWHKLFSAEEPGRLEWVRRGCTTAGIGCIECKEAMANNLIKWIAPIRERRAYYEGKKKLVRQIIQDGSLEARRVAVRTMRRVRDAVFGKERILRKTLPGPAKTKRPASRARAGDSG